MSYLLLSSLKSLVLSCLFTKAEISINLIVITSTLKVVLYHVHFKNNSRFPSRVYDPTRACDPTRAYDLCSHGFLISFIIWGMNFLL